MWEERDANHAARQAEITAKQAEKMAGESETDPPMPYESFETIAENTDSIASDVGSIKKSVNMSDEDTNPGGPWRSAAMSITSI